MIDLVQVVSVTKKGQATIPKKLRKKYGIKNKVLIEEDEKGIILKPLPSPDEDFGSLKSALKGKSAKELLEEARKEETAKDKEWVNVPERLTFDSEAILAFYLGEKGGEVVRDSIEKIQNGAAEGYINILNLTEIYYILNRVDPKVAEEKQRNLRLYGLKIVPIEDDGLWREAARIKSKHSLSLADAFAVATAEDSKIQACGGQRQRI